MRHAPAFEVPIDATGRVREIRCASAVHMREAGARARTTKVDLGSLRVVQTRRSTVMLNGAKVAFRCTT
ncbi:hypothetical protein P3T24_004985 [Paraburkholderia sp. GAS33]|uniref:hypothetical protein n=1 Tax=unclassified Paraburkholderia TaxID=2615204 RepID=UPI003D19EBFA